MRADLHIHTYYSDGLMSPSEVVTEAKLRGVDVIAITDHDTMLGFPEAQKAAKEKGIKVVAGLEVSAYKDGVKLHTLGYNVDCNREEFKTFAKQLFDGSLRRAEESVYLLNKNGVYITMDDVLCVRKSENSPVHSMHIAAAGAAKGYADNRFTFYLQYLAPGKCANSQLCRPSPEHAIEVINACGGFTSLAHPGRIEMEKQQLISLVKKLSSCGLCGIEAVYSTHTNEETAYYKEMASKFGLLITGGSDTHYKGGRKQIGTPVFDPDETLADKLGIEEK